MAIQGFDIFALRNYDRLATTEHQLADMAGNALGSEGVVCSETPEGFNRHSGLTCDCCRCCLRFAVNCIGAAFLALITSMRWTTESEDEEMDNIQKLPLGPVNVPIPPA